MLHQSLGKRFIYKTQEINQRYVNKQLPTSLLLKPLFPLIDQTPSDNLC